MWEHVKLPYLQNNIHMTDNEFYSWMSQDDALARAVLVSEDPILYAWIPGVIVKAMRVRNYGLLKTIFDSPNLFQIEPNLGRPLEHIMELHDVSDLVILALFTAKPDHVKDIQAGKSLINYCTHVIRNFPEMDVLG